MATPLRVLIVDDSEDDAFLLIRYLTRGGFELTWERVDTEPALISAMGEKTWDIILSDFSMPRFNGLEALRVIRERNFAIPVILVSGAIGEEIAVEAIKAGAQDYVLKDNLTRLVPSVERSLREAQNRLARYEAEAALQESQARLLSETTQRLQELDALNRISLRLRSANVTQEILPGFLEEAQTALDSPHAAVILYQPNSMQLAVAWSTGNLRSYQGSQHSIHPEVKAFLTEEAPLYVTKDLDSDSFLNNLGLIADVGPLMVVPMRSVESVIGLLLVGRDRGQPDRDYMDNDQRLATTIAELGGNALHRARLFEQTHQRVQRLSVLHAIDMTVSSSMSIEITLNLILDQIVTQLNIDAASVLSFKDQANVLELKAARGFRRLDKVKRTRIRVGQSFPGNAVLDRKPISIMDLTSEQAFIQMHYLDDERFTSYFVVPLIAKGQPKGVLELFHHEPILADPELRDFFESLAAQTAIAMDNIDMFVDLKQKNIERTRAFDAVIESWARSMELREALNQGHAQRTTEMMMRLAAVMAINGEQLPHLRRGALLHDIGMISIPEEILLKRGPLSETERKIVAEHPRHAHEILAGIHFLAPALEIPMYHHEHWDGSGYPDGMVGDQIPLSARMFAVVDVWDALTHERSYRPAKSRHEAMQYLRQEAGKHFDPDVVEKFLRELPQLDSRFGELRD